MSLKSVCYTTEPYVV